MCRWPDGVLVRYFPIDQFLELDASQWLLGKIGVEKFWIQWISIWLITWIMVRLQVWVSKCFFHCDALLWRKSQ